MGCCMCLQSRWDEGAGTITLLGDTRLYSTASRPADLNIYRSADHIPVIGGVHRPLAADGYYQAKHEKARSHLLWAGHKLITVVTWLDLAIYGGQQCTKCDKTKLQ